MRSDHEGLHLSCVIITDVARGVGSLAPQWNNVLSLLKNIEKCCTFWFAKGKPKKRDVILPISQRSSKVDWTKLLQMTNKWIAVIFQRDYCLQLE